MKFPLYYLSSSRLQKKENFRLFSSKSGRGLLQEEVIYKRSQCNDLTRILLVFCKLTGRRGEMVPYERRSQPEARLYEKLAPSFGFLGPCRRIWSLHIVVLQRTAMKCSKIYDARVLLIRPLPINILHSENSPIKKMRPLIG